MQGATNDKLHNADGVCIAPTIVKLAPGEPWPSVAADVVASAGRRSLPLPPLVAPALSPPVNATENQMNTAGCVKFAARPCDASKLSQRWTLSPGVKPGDGKPTIVKSAIKNNASCWQANNGGFGTTLTCDYFLNTDGAHGGCPSKTAGPDGCKPLPTTPYDPEDKTHQCAYDQAFQFSKSRGLSVRLASCSSSSSKV